MFRFGIVTGSSAFIATIISKSIFASSPPNDRKIKLSELPLYDANNNEPSFVVERENISLFRGYVSEVRKFAWGYIGSMEGMITSVKDKYNVAEGHTKETLAYIHEDSAVLPRIAIITVAGLGGVIAGYRGGIFKKFIYSSIAITTAATVCYPKEAYEIGGRSWDYLKDTTHDLWSPTKKSEGDKLSETANKGDEIPNKEKEAECNDKGNIVKNASNMIEDHGMTNPADKDMYSNRDK